MKTVLLTGVLGFIGSNMIRKMNVNFPAYRWVGVDIADRQENMDNLHQQPNYNFYFADIADDHIMNRIFQVEKPDIVIGMAAQSNVDNSITDISPFLHSNILGTQNLVNQCLRHNVARYIHISTDEVYGQKLTINDLPWVETNPLLARNPYSASKAAAELIVQAAHHTHNLQYNITRCCNVFGPRQKAQNLIPHIITSIANNTAIRIHGTGLNFRQYIHVNDKINAIMTILEEGEPNQTYNIGADNYYSNLEMVNNIAEIMKKPPKIVHIEDRKGHDYGYSVSSNKLRQLSWRPEEDFHKALVSTVRSYCDQRTGK